MRTRIGAIAQLFTKAGATGTIILTTLFIANSNFLNTKADPLNFSPSTNNLATLTSAVAYNAANKPIRLEIRLNSRQAILYQGDVPIKRYPIGIGRPGWETPKGNFRVLQMKRNPTWISPFTDEAISPNDPRNPLGGYFIGFWTNGRNWIGFHGTLDPNSIGNAASHGCIHMRTSDLKDLYAQVNLGTPVKVTQ
jgi:lipoprotein-anchoring transpeptidase ErfK/SrfK